MNRSTLGRIVPAVLGLLILAYAAFGVWAWITFDDEQYLPAFRWEVTGRRALLTLLDYLAPIIAVGVVAASSLGPAAGRTDGPALPFVRVVASAVVGLVVIAAGSLVLSETLGTASRRRLDELASRTTLARSYREQAGAAEREKRWQEAAEAWEGVLAIDPQDAVAERHMLDADQAAAALRAAQRETPAPAPRPPAGVSAADLVRKAEYYFAQADWYSAHWYASRAAGADPRRTDAARLAARALERMAGERTDGLDAAARDLAKGKKQAYDLLRSGDWLAAWRRFSDLAARFPDDADVKEFLAESLEQLRAQAFFVDEAERGRAVPGARNLLFINRSTSEEVEVVWIGGMASPAPHDEPGAPEERVTVDTFCYDIEAIAYHPSGKVLWHLSASAARLDRTPGQPDRLLLRGVDRSDAARAMQPLYHEGTRPAAVRAILELGPTAEELAALSTDRPGYDSYGLVELWGLRQRIGTRGRLVSEIELGIALRAAEPFVVLVLGLLSLALGWSLRARWSGSKTPLFAYLAVPVIGVATAILAGLLVHAHRVLLAFLVLAAGFAAALVAAAVLELVLVAGCLVLLAGQSSA